MKSIHSPVGVSLLMENIWLRHKTGMPQRAGNVFMVELPPPTDEELAKLAVRPKKMHVPMMNPKNCMEHGFDRYDLRKKV